MPLRKEVDLEKTVAAASGVFRDVCSEAPPYHTAEELWEGLKHGDEGARLLFVFFLRLRKNERTRCSVEKAIAAEGKRWVGVLIEEAWRLYLLMRHRAVPYLRVLFRPVLRIFKPLILNLLQSHFENLETTPFL